MCFTLECAPEVPFLFWELPIVPYCACQAILVPQPRASRGMAGAHGPKQPGKRKAEELPGNGKCPGWNLLACWDGRDGSMDGSMAAGTMTERQGMTQMTHVKKLSGRLSEWI